MNKGDRRMIYNQTWGGEEMEEGYAVLKKLVKAEPHGEIWEVEFEDEKGRTYPRFIPYSK